MRTTLRAVLLVLGALAATACSWHRTETEVVVIDETPSDDRLTTIELDPKMPMSIVTDTEGHTTMTIQVQDGPHAGTYVSTSPHHIDEFRSLQETLGEPGVFGAIEVNEKNEIVVISHGVTMQ